MSNLVGDIATSLFQYGASKGYSLPFSYYKKLAWGGLTGYYDASGNPILYDFFISAVPIEADRIEILDIIEAEHFNTTVSGHIPKGHQPNSNAPCN